MLPHVMWRTPIEVLIFLDLFKYSFTSLGWSSFLFFLFPPLSQIDSRIIRREMWAQQLAHWAHGVSHGLCPQHSLPPSMAVVLGHVILNSATEAQPHSHHGHEVAIEPLPVDAAVWFVSRPAVPRTGGRWAPCEIEAVGSLGCQANAHQGVVGPHRTCAWCVFVEPKSTTRAHSWPPGCVTENKFATP